jgi:hypothetical protein
MEKKTKLFITDVVETSLEEKENQGDQKFNPLRG